MARPRKKGSKNSYGGYGLKSPEEKQFQEKLEVSGLSARIVVRAFIRAWLKQEGTELPKVNLK